MHFAILDFFFFWDSVFALLFSNPLNCYSLVSVLHLDNCNFVTLLTLAQVLPPRQTNVSGANPLLLCEFCLFSLIKLNSRISGQNFHLKNLSVLILIFKK